MEEGARGQDSREKERERESEGERDNEHRWVADTVLVVKMGR
jgi:hypothetical protein